MSALTTAAVSSRRSWRSVALALGRGVAAGALLLGGSQAALAAFAPAPTVQCTGQCQGCMEMESTPDGKGRCTKCGVLPTCLGNDGGMYDAATNMLNATNSDRALHGSPPLTWSSDLAKQAQAWADTCPFNDPNNAAAGFKHSIERGAFSAYGENLYWTSKNDDSGSVDAVNWWYNERNNYNFDDPIKSYQNAINGTGPEVRHFTQLVWKDTKDVGCAMNTCTDTKGASRQLWVCQYGPPGNFNGENPGVLNNEVGRARSNLQPSALRPKVPSILGPVSRYSPADLAKLLRPTPRLPAQVAPYALKAPPQMAAYPAQVPVEQPPVARYPVPSVQIPAPMVLRPPMLTGHPIPPAARPPVTIYYPLPPPVRPPATTNYPVHPPVRPPWATHYPIPRPVPPPVTTSYPVHPPVRPPWATHYPLHRPVLKPPLAPRYPIPAGVQAPSPRLAAMRAKPAVKYLQRVRQHPLTYLRRSHATGFRSAMVRRYRRH